MMFLALLQEHAAGTAEHAAEAAGHGGGQGEHIPWIVEEVNDLFGPAVLSTLTVGLMGWECFTTYRDCAGKEKEGVHKE